MKENSIMSSVHVDDRTAEIAIIASNGRLHKLRKRKITTFKYFKNTSLNYNQC